MHFMSLRRRRQRFFRSRTAFECCMIIIEIQMHIDLLITAHKRRSGVHLKRLP
jgi:hypothetical protein